MRRAIDYELVDFEQGFAEPPKTHLRGHQGAAKQGSQPDPIINLGGVIPGFRIVLFPDRKGNILELMEGYRTRNMMSPQQNW